jgi:thiol-disulfide isomerase/thioredoxin
MDRYLPGTLTEADARAGRRPGGGLALGALLTLLMIAAMPNAVLASEQALAEARKGVRGALEGFELHKEPKPLPTLNITDEAGNPIDLETFRGRVVLLNIWATWCAPCVAEMPSLNQLQAKAGGAEFAVIPLSLDRGPGLVQDFYRKRDLQNLLIFMDSKGGSVADLNIKGLPTSILIDAEGREVGRLTGDADWRTPEVIDLIGAYVRDARRNGGS